MGQFVSDDAFQFIPAQNPQDALRDCHDSVFFVTSGGEGVRGFLGDDVDPGHGEPPPQGEVTDHAVQFRRLAFGDFLGIVHP